MDERIASDFSGTMFLDRISELENSCAKFTGERLPQLGERAPVCYETLGMVLVLLDCAASCWWGCSRGDHRLEYLLGRAANSAYAAILLMKRGYYDQVMTAARGLGEIANLLVLFNVDDQAMDRWKHATEAARRREFSAVKVRVALERLDTLIPVEEERYRLLSSYSIHADPDSLPQAHDERARAKTAPAYQEAGLLIALNEIAWPIACITLFVPKLIGLSKEHANTFQEAAGVLMESVGGINVEQKGRPWFNLH
jgi:hypothetical protein